MPEKFPACGICSGGNADDCLNPVLQGYVRISVRGYAPERFMNLCANRAIVLWELNGHDGFYTMCISLSDFFKIRDIVHKTKTRVAVLEKRGLPFFLQDVRHRKNVLARGFFYAVHF